MNMPKKAPFLWSNQKLQINQKRRRLFFWVLFYVTVILIFGISVNSRIKLVDTKIIPNGQIVLAATKVKYNSGDTVQVVLTNGMPNTIYLNNECPQEPLSVYRFENNVWARIHITIDNSTCTNQQKQIAIPSNATYTIDYGKWSQLFSTPGIYRVAALANNYTGLAYTDFDILAPPAKPITPTTQIIYQTIYTPVYIQQPVYVQVPAKTTPTQTAPTQTPTSTGTTGTGSTGGSTRKHNDN